MIGAKTPIAEGQERRVGTRVLELLAVPLNGMIVLALGQGPLRQAELRCALGNPAETTLRRHLARLEDLGVIQRRVRVGGPQFAKSELTGRGIDLLIATRALEGWLSRAPNEPIRLGTMQAKGAVKALVGGWDSMLLRALAAKQLTLTQLDRLLGALSYPALERRLSAMRATGLLEATAGSGGTLYRVTRWTRLGVGPIVAAAFFERLHMEEAAPLSPIDIEAAFLLATPISPLPVEADGVCSLAAETDNGAGRGRGRRAGVEVTVDRGRIVSCITRLSGEARNFAVGPALDWFEALIHRRPEQLQVGGDAHLPNSLVHGIHAQLFDPARFVI